jgi:hypothetical protein
LTYEPPVDPADGKFRRVRATLHDPSLRALTKAGYFSPNRTPTVYPRKQKLIDISEAICATIPLSALALTIEDLVRHPNSGRVEFTVVLKSGNIPWETGDNGRSTTNLMLAAASLDENRAVLAGKLETLGVTAATQDVARLPETVTRLPVRLRIPPKTRSVRVVVEAADNDRIGAVEIDSRTLNSAPLASVPEKLIPRPLEQ